MELIHVLSISTVFLLITIIYFKKCYTYWKKRGLYYLEPEFFHGNTKQMNTQELSLGHQMEKFYKELKAKGLRHGGIYSYFTPMYIPVDLELIKCIMQKDFAHFMNRGIYANPKDDPLSDNLLSLEDAKWKNLRGKLTPTFTSGKMKMMFQTMADCSSGLKDLLNEYTVTQEVVDTREVLARFTTDIIGSCAFGLECNSIKNPDSEFRKYGRRVFEETYIEKIKFLIQFAVPGNILRKVGFRVTDREVETFFMKVVRDTVEYREKNKIFRKDFMHLLLQLKNLGELTDDERIIGKESQQVDLTLDELAAQCFLFFLAGFETSSTAVTYTLYELAVNQDIQEKLRREIRSVLKRHGGKLTYEAVMEMSYLDKVLNESLRKYPPVGVVPRKCTKAYSVPDSNVVIEPGTMVEISIRGIHHDPEYYPNPDVFDPERFSEENKATRPGFAFIPFGEGPRICIGLRFGLLQSKVGLISTINDFKITLSTKTKTPLEYATSGIITTTKDPVWLNVSKAE